MNLTRRRPVVPRRWWPDPARPTLALVAALLALDAASPLAERLFEGLDVVAVRPRTIFVLLLTAVHLWRRRAPLAVFGITLVGLVASQTPQEGAVLVLSHGLGVQLVAAAFGVGSWGPSRVRAMVVPGAVALLAGIAAWADPANSSVEAVTLPVLTIVLPWVAGDLVRTRRQYVEQVEARLADAERERDARAATAVAEERARVARELHDVVAHHVTLIGVLAGAARTTVDGAGAVAESLVGIEREARTAMEEMHRLAGVLRGEAGDDGAPRSPSPGLADLPVLVEGFRDAGLDADLHCDEGTDVDDALALSVYRIVEQALTNVTQHSSASTARVEVQIRANEIDLRVRDDGPRHDAVHEPSGGRGLVGMRERVAPFGGTFSAEPAGHGWMVHAVLPRTSLATRADTR